MPAQDRVKLAVHASRRLNAPSGPLGHLPRSLPLTVEAASHHPLPKAISPATPTSTRQTVNGARP